MRTSRRLLRQVRRALAVACLPSAASTALALVAPLSAWHLVDAVLPAPSIATIIKLAAATAAAGLALTVIEVCRDRIVLPVLTGERTLLDKLLDPLVHAIARAVRSLAEFTRRAVT